MDKPLIIAFGSRVSGRSTDFSDYDFGVFSDKPLSLEDRGRLAEYLADKFDISEDKIDLIDLFSASPLLKFEAAKRGRLVEGSTFSFIRYKVHAFKQYQDTARFRRMRERVMMQNHV